MADPKERRNTPRKAATATPKPDTGASAPDTRAAAPRRPTSNLRTDASPEEIRRLIAEAAYYRAMDRGFEPGHELEDWIEAESQVMDRISGGER